MHINDSIRREGAERPNQNARRSLLHVRDMEDIRIGCDGMVLIAAPSWLRGERRSL